MSAQGRIEIAPPHLDLNDFYNPLKDANRSAKRNTESIAKRVARGAASLSRATASALVTVPGVIAGVAATEETLRKIHEAALSDRGYQDTVGQVRNAFDSLIDGVLGSKVVQAGMNAAANALLRLAETMRSRDLARDALTRVRPAFELTKAAFDTMVAGVRTIAGGLTMLLADTFADMLEVVQGWSLLGTGIESMLRASPVGVPFQLARGAATLLGVSTSAADVIAFLRRASNKTAVVYGEQFDRFEDAFARGQRAFGALFEQETTPRNTGEEVREQTRSFMGDLIEFLTEWLGGRRVDSFANTLDTLILDGIANAEAAFQGISVAIEGLTESARQTASEMVPVLQASTGLSDAFAMVARNGEQIANSSAVASMLMARGKLIVLGVLSTIRASIETAKAIVAFATGAGERGALHAVAAAGFATAAGLAFAGSASSGARRPTPVTVANDSGDVLSQIGSPPSSGDLTVIVDGSVLANDPNWVDDNILRSIESGAPAPSSRIVSVSERQRRRSKSEEQFDRISGEAARLLLLPPELLLLDALGLNVGARAGEEARRLGRRVGREARRITRRLGF